MVLSHECGYPEPDNADQIDFMSRETVGRSAAAPHAEEWGRDLIFSDMDFSPRFEHQAV